MSNQTSPYRQGPNSNSGWVKWPVHLDRGDPGCFVVAVFRDLPEHAGKFVRCMEMGLVHVLRGEAVAAPGFDYASLWPRENNPDFDGLHQILSADLHAAITLGSCGSAFLTPEGHTWAATRDDLAPEALVLIDALERLYGTEALVLTYIDT